MKEGVTKKSQPSPIVERGVNLDVPGRAIIAQADERIRWHKRVADLIAAELKEMPLKAGADAPSNDDWKLMSRRTDLQSRMNGHLEYARFLSFVRQHIVRDRRYRLGLHDMSSLEIMPKGSYY